MLSEYMCDLEDHSKLYTTIVARWLVPTENDRRHVSIQADLGERMLARGHIYYAVQMHVVRIETKREQSYALRQASLPLKSI